MTPGLRFAAISCIIAIGCSAAEPSSSSSAPSAPAMASAVDPAGAPEARGSAEARVETGGPSAKPTASVDERVDAGARVLMLEPPAGNLGVLANMRKDFQACWKAEPNGPEGPTEGKVEISVTLKTDGTLGDVAVTGFEKHKPFTSCIIGVVEAGKFLAPAEGDPKLAFTLNFAVAR